MKITITLFLLLVVPAVTDAQSKFDIGGLRWMAGCWELNRPNLQTFVNEQWMLPMGNSMVGMSRTVREGRLTEFEYLRIVQKGDEINLIALPSATDKPVAFKMTAGTKTQVAFENNAHDFPQKITYTLNSNGTMLAMVEGRLQGKTRRNVYPMARGKCAE